MSPHGEHGVPDDADDPLARARRHILRLEAMNSVLHADLVALRGRLQILCTEHRHQPAEGHQHGQRRQQPHRPGQPARRPAPLAWPEPPSR